MPSLAEKLRDKMQGEIHQIGIRRGPAGQWLCYYCGRPLEEALPSVDHVTPRSRGGVEAEFNKVYACYDCNRNKNGKHPIYWLMRGAELGLMNDEQVIDFLARVLLHSMAVPEPGEAYTRPTVAYERVNT